MIKLTLAMLRNVATMATICLLIPTFAFKSTPNDDEITVANQTPRMKQYYFLQRALKNNVAKNKVGVLYATEPLEPNIYPEELHALRNYILLLNNSIETSTPKGGNVKVKKYDPYEFKDAPCTCEQQNREVKLLGDDYFPPAIETRKCNAALCPVPYGCKERLHKITVLRRKRYFEEPSEEELPEDLEKRWIAVKETVVVACMCLKQYSNFDISA